VARLGEDIIYTDGHTRAYAAFLRGHSEVNVYWDPDELDREMYEICVAWCKEEGIRAIRDLQGRVVSVDEYQTLWIQRCATMHREVRARRARG